MLNYQIFLNILLILGENPVADVSDNLFFSHQASRRHLSLRLLWRRPLPGSRPAHLQVGLRRLVRLQLQHQPSGSVRPSVRIASGALTFKRTETSSLWFSKLRLSAPLHHPGLNGDFRKIVTDNCSYMTVTIVTDASKMITVDVSVLRKYIMEMILT